MSEQTPGTVRGAALLYGLLTAGAFTWVLAGRGTADLYHHPHPLWRMSLGVGLVGGIAAGTAIGLALAGLTRWGVHRMKWAGALQAEFRALLGPLPDGDIFALAAFSALAEECFFRGALQPTVGLVAASLIFGAMHIPVNRRFIPWTLQATAVGFLLGALYWTTGQLAAPVAVHFTVNYENLHFVRRYRQA